MASIIAEGSARAWEGSGSVGVRGEAYREESPREPERTRAEMDLRGELRTEGRVRFVLAGRARWDTSEWFERELRLDPLERRERGSLLQVDEAYLHARFSDLELRAGKIVYAWGSADGFNPTDNLDPRDYVDPLRAEKLGCVSTHLGWQRGDLGVDLVVVPVYQPSRLPGSENRFTPDLPATAPNPFFPGAGPEELVLRYDLARELPPVGWEQVQEALRVTWKLPGSQLNASYQRLLSDLPVFDVRVGLPDLGAGTLPVDVFSRPYRQDVWGLDFQGAAGEYGLRGEVARSTSDEPLAEEYVVAVLGADRRFADIVGEQDLTLIVSLLGRRITRPSEAALGVGLLNVELPFEEGLLLHALWELSDDLSVDVSLFGAFSDGDYEEVLLSWRIAEPVKLEVKLERAAGPADSYLGIVEEHGRLWAALRYSF